MLTACTPRLRFYRPLLGHGVDQFKHKWGCIYKEQEVWAYRHRKIDPRPFPDPPINDYYGRQRLWNAIPSKVGFVAKKAREWGYPHRDPPPTGLRQSREFFPYFMEQYFPDVECKLVLDSVLNTPTRYVKFGFPPHMSRKEIGNYLRNIYGFDNIRAIVKYTARGQRYKNEIGTIKTIPDEKIATVILDDPVEVVVNPLKKSNEEEDVKPALSS